MWLLALLACSPTGLPDPPDIEPIPDIDPDPNPDLDLVRALIGGQGVAEEVLQEIAWSDGWPVQDDEHWLFVRITEAADPGLAGDFNTWTSVPMTAGDGFFWAEVPITDATGQKYKFVEGQDWISDPYARSYTFDDEGRASYVAPPVDVFHLELWPDLDGGALLSRDLRVYVPPGEGVWPVLYMHDGQNLFDPQAGWGGWRLQDTLAQASPMIVVGIDNTADRFDEYTHVPDDIGEVVGGSGDAYADLVHEIVRPHIEENYGVSGLTGVAGSSLGGLVSLHIAQRFPGEYDFVASLSGTLGWGRFGLENETMQARWGASSPEIVVFADSGGDAGANGCEDPDGDGSTADDPDATDGYCTTRDFVDGLSADGFTWDVDLWHWHEPGDPHNESAWAARVARPIGIFSALE